MHIEIHSNGLVWVRVVPLGGEHEYARKLGVAIERTDAGDNVAVEDLERLSSDDDFASYETRTARGEVIVDDRIELPDILERQSEQFDKLDSELD